jgi:hypothetical protein
MTFLEFTQRKERNISPKIPRITAMQGKKKYPAFWELSDEGLRDMMLIRQPHDIKTVEDIAWWEDDHEPCFGAKINGTFVSFWWMDEQMGLALLHKHTVTIRSAIADEIDRLEDQDEHYKRIQRILKEIAMLDAMKSKTKEAFLGIV